MNAYDVQMLKVSDLDLRPDLVSLLMKKYESSFLVPKLLSIAAYLRFRSHMGYRTASGEAQIIADEFCPEYGATSSPVYRPLTGNYLKTNLLAYKYRYLAWYNTV
jgi:hypothetical protein